MIVLLFDSCVTVYQNVTDEIFSEGSGLNTNFEYNVCILKEICMCTRV